MHGAGCMERSEVSGMMTMDVYVGCPNKYHVENLNLSLGMRVTGLIHGERCVAIIGPVI